MGGWLTSNRIKCREIRFNHEKMIFIAGMKHNSLLLHTYYNFNKINAHGSQYPRCKCNNLLLVFSVLALLEIKGAGIASLVSYLPVGGDREINFQYAVFILGNNFHSSRIGKDLPR